MSPGPPSPCRIRTAEPADYDGLCEIFAYVDALHREALPHIYRAPNGPVRARDYIESILADQDHVVFVAERDGRMVGILHASIQRSRDIPILVPRQYLMIENLAVRQSERRRGIGRLLVEHAHRWARDKGIAQVELVVAEFNTDAIAFYEHLGYVTASRKMWKNLE